MRGQGSNSANLRLFNERVILAALRRLGEASKADLARFARLTDNTAGVIVRELEAQRLVRRGGKRAGERGQPATLLSLDPGGAYAIGVKIGRRSSDALLVDFAGHVVERRRHEHAFLLPEAALDLAADSVAALRDALPREARGRLAGLGVAAPSQMGSWRRELDIPDDAYAAWNGFAIAPALAARTGLPAIGENDGNAAALAELFRGHGRRIDDFLYVTIGTAVGGGVVMGGDYLRGGGGNAGDLGLMPVPASRLDTAPRPAGRWDVLLTRASMNGLIRHLRGRGVAVSDGTELVAAAARHPGPVDEWLEDCADALTGPLLSAVRTLDLDTVVVDGTLPRPLLERLVGRTAELLAEAAPEARPAPALLLGETGREAAAIGAALLPLHMNFSPNRAILVNQTMDPL